ncbi:Hypothetical protein PHPALM_5892 [Phytophthora palmivora]|uniref:Uncharacterized protein n=1 Tax=Phytophthora palmivora TaxID=4796 RepID=A0A2P4YG90_9STRA|nr:Hypothetical protein PHPALM_5892 [Phytophthora palmivora]
MIYQSTSSKSIFSSSRPGNEKIRSPITHDKTQQQPNVTDVITDADVHKINMIPNPFELFEGTFSNGLRCHQRRPLSTRSTGLYGLHKAHDQRMRLSALDEPAHTAAPAASTQTPPLPTRYPGVGADFKEWGSENTAGWTAVSNTPEYVMNSMLMLYMTTIPSAKVIDLMAEEKDPNRSFHDHYK